MEPCPCHWVYVGAAREERRLPIFFPSETQRIMLFNVKQNEKRGTVIRENKPTKSVLVEWDESNETEWVERRNVTRVATRSTKGLHEDVRDEAFHPTDIIY